MEAEGIVIRKEGVAMRAKRIALIAEGIAMGTEEVALGAEGIAIEGLHTMYINDAMLVGGAFQPLHLVQWADLGDLKRVIGAPNHLH